jgi:hypothetical protein
MFIPQRTTVLFDLAAEPVEKPDARLFALRLGIERRHGKVNSIRSAMTSAKTNMTCDPNCQSASGFSSNPNHPELKSASQRIENRKQKGSGKGCCA